MRCLIFYLYLIASFSLNATEDENTIHDLVIIGSGPGGLTAALYAGRAGLKPLVICGTTPGGQLTIAKTVSNWLGIKQISGENLIKNFMDHAADYGAQYFYDTVTSITTNRQPFGITTKEGKTFFARTIIIATGTKQKRLLCKGEDEYWGKGISHCSLCDGAFFKNKNVLVVGGSNAALENARHLKNFTTNITIVTQEKEFTADAHIKNEILQDPLYTIYYNCSVQEFLGDKNSLKNAVLLFQDNKKEKMIPIDGAFIAIGFTPNLDCIADCIPPITTKNDSVNTSVNGIFIAVSPQYNQAIISSGLGCAAAIEAIKYLGR